MVSRLMWPLVLLQIAAVVTIIMFLKMLLHKQLEIGLTRIKKLDEDNLKKETEINKRLQQLDKECNMRLGEAERQGKAMIEAAKEEIRKMREEERDKAKDEAKRTIAGALQQKEKLLKEMEHEIFSKGIDFSEMILKHIFSEDDLKELKAKVSREVMDILLASERISRLVLESKEIEVITSDALDGEDKKRITKIITEKTKESAEIKFTTDKNILGGLVLKIGDEIIDGSIAYRVHKAAQEIKEKGINSV